MKNLIGLFPSVILVLLIGCNSKENRIIENYELLENHIKVIQIDSLGSFVPIHAGDSIKLLELRYNFILAEKLESLNYQLEMATTKIQNIENELDSIENPLMVAAVENRIKLMKEDQARIETIISIYQNKPEATNLKLIKERMNHLRQFSDSLLGYTLQVSFWGKQGALPKEIYKRNYLFTVEKDSILGLFNPTIQL